MLIYDLTILATGMVAGFMLSYCVTLGHYYNFLLKTHRNKGFSDYYSVFRRQENISKRYAFCMGSQFVVGLLAVLFAQSHASLTALLPLPFLLLCHRLTGFGKAEETIVSGQSFDERQRQLYLHWNIPLHLTYSLVYACACLYLLFYR